MADKQDSVKSNHQDQQAGAEEEVAMLDDQLQADAAEPLQEDAGQDAAGGAERTTAQPTTAQLQVQINALEEQLTAAQEQTLRAAAEMQNVRKRAERDVENAHKYGQEKLLASLLPVLDNLDRALDAAGTDVQNGVEGGDASTSAEVLKAIVEGVELTRKSAQDVLRQFSIEVLEPYGEPFDPQLHEAMTMVPSDTAEPNSVIDVLQKGYRLHGRLLRAAMVVVAKP